MIQTNKIALITGGSRGLGRNTALKLAADGHRVVITYRSKKEAQDVLKDIEQLGSQAIVLQFDQADIKSFDAFIDRLAGAIKQKWDADKIDFLVNNAGINLTGLIADFSEDDFDSLVNVHFKGVFFLTQKVLPILADGGRIVNFSTGLARFVLPGYAAYSSMKAAIENFTKYLAKELGKRGITANTVAPGPIETDFTRDSFEEDPKRKDFLASQTALGRVGQPDDIGNVVAFLCSDAAGWVTAQRIEASGGTFL